MKFGSFYLVSKILRKNSPFLGYTYSTFTKCGLPDPLGEDHFKITTAPLSMHYYKAETNSGMLQVTFFKIKLWAVYPK